MDDGTADDGMGGRPAAEADHAPPGVHPVRGGRDAETLSHGRLEQPDGALVPGYRLQRQLGAGGTGTVWQALEESTGDLVAVKLVRASGGRRRSTDHGRAHPDDATERLLRECALLRRVRNRHVVRLRGTVRAGDGRVGLVLDLASGGNLRDLVRSRGPLPPVDVVNLVAPLAEALRDLHAQGVLHGDISPGNVVLSGEGRPLLADLGVARLVGERRGAAVHGTAGFVAPEIAAGGRPSAASDVYGLAAVAWYALTAARPSADVRVPWRRGGSAAEGPGSVARVPKPLRRVLRRALSRRIGARPGPAALAASLLAALPGGEPAESPLLAEVAGPRRTPVSPAAPSRPISRVAVENAVTAQIRAVAHQPATIGRDGAHRRHRRPWLLAASAAVLAVAAGTTAASAGGWPATWWPVSGRPVPGGPVWLPAPHADAPAASGSAGMARQPDGARSAASAEPSPVRSGVGDRVLSGYDLREVVAELANRRALALLRADRTLLSGVDAPGSQALAADTAQLDALVQSGRRLRGLSFEVLDTQRLSGAQDRVVVRVSVATSAFVVVSRRGAVLARQASRPARSSRLTLVRTGDQWRVLQVGGPG